MNKTLKIIIGIALTLVLIIGSSIGYYAYENNKNQIFPGVKIDGESLSGLNKDEARAHLNSVFREEYSNNKVRFKSDYTSYSYSQIELGLTQDLDSALESAYSYGRSNNQAKNVLDVVVAGIYGKNISLDRSYDEAALDSVLKEMADKVYTPAENAKLALVDGRMEIEEEVNRKYLDITETKELFLNNNQAEVLTLPIYVVEADITRDSFAGINGVIGSFSTDYKSSESNRKHNIKLGSEAVSDILLNPGQEVSFNDTVGDISAETGYKNSGVIINGEFDTGVGGGICQVSTTLYNALLKADVSITERSNHSRPIGYVPKGTDAAVVIGYKDLKFVNNFDFPIYISSFSDGETLEFTVYGDKNIKNYDVEIIPELLGTSSPKTVKRYSPSVPAGKTKVDKSGSTGYYYKTYKKIIKDGETISTEEISTSSYPAQTRVVLYGPEKRQNTQSNTTQTASNSTSNSNSTN